MRVSYQHLLAPLEGQVINAIRICKRGKVRRWKGLRKHEYEREQGRVLKSRTGQEGSKRNGEWNERRGKGKE